MTDTPAKPLTAHEIDDLVRCNYFSTRLGRQIFATIEQQREQIEKLRGALLGIDPSWYEDDSPENNAIREVLIGVGPKP